VADDRTVVGVPAAPIGHDGHILQASATTRRTLGN
jgi:hypothetical protein